MERFIGELFDKYQYRLPKTSREVVNQAVEVARKLGIVLEKGISGIGVQKRQGIDWRALLLELSTLGTPRTEQVIISADRIAQIKARQEFDLQVKGLRGQQLSNTQIADQLQVPVWKVGQASHSLITQGETERRKTGGGRRPQDNTRVLEDIKTLRAQGLKNDEIREKLGLTLGQYHARLQKLMKAGEVEAKPKGGGARFAIEQVLEQYMAQNPGKAIILADVAREVGLSRERVRQLFHQIAAKREVPPLISRGLNGPQDEFDQKVRELLLEDLDISEITKKLHVTRNIVAKARVRINRIILKEREEIIKPLREQGLTDKRITEITDLPGRVVSRILQNLYKRGEAEKPRKQYRTRQEAKLFTEQVAQLKHDPRNLSHAQIAKITGESIPVVWNYIRKLQVEGRVPLRVSRKPRTAT